MPLGQTKGKWNYNLDEKRVLNFENVVNDDDNIKQDLSIDVYGRASEEDAEDGAKESKPAAAPAPAAAAKEVHSSFGPLLLAGFCRVICKMAGGMLYSLEGNRKQKRLSCGASEEGAKESEPKAAAFASAAAVI